MIKNLSKLFFAIFLLTLGGGIVANAQIDSDSSIQGNVPFAFVVGRTTLPAGKYEIRGIDDNTPGVLEIRSMDGRIKVVFETDAAIARDDEPARKTEIVFDKVDNKYFLTQVWVEGNGSGSQLIESKTEKRLEGGGGQHESHSIAAILKHGRR